MSMPEGTQISQIGAPAPGYVEIATAAPIGGSASALVDLPYYSRVTLKIMKRRRASGQWGAISFKVLARLASRWTGPSPGRQPAHVDPLGGLDDLL